MAGLQIPPGTIRLDDTLGAAFLGHTVTTLLYGITTLQAFIYYRRNQKDGIKLKLSVFVLCVHAGLITGAIYWYCVTSFTDLLAIQRPIWPIPSMLSGSPDFAVQLYSIPSYTGISKFSWSLYVGLSVEVAVDVTIAVTQCLLLRRFETGIQRTDSVIRILIAYSINTGLLTSLCAIGALVSYAAAPTKFIYFAFYFVLSKLYVNSLLATLNARGSLLGGARRGARPRSRVQSKIAFRTPTLSTDPSGSSAMEAGTNIEFTTVISGGEISTDEIVESVKDKRIETFP
ncbi:hypothetical protein ONZ51_g10688 [Trametes cubensis]|uniref:DUF6534 domain-containing protein n=1 Tax=Trametes cubensis TaxID=1111947 RepID=A0AAD7TIZ8_9APHY|nr:hypothetical protein ONZ51_g10688 [Trametes cubensis]